MGERHRSQVSQVQARRAQQARSLAWASWSAGVPSRPRGKSILSSLSRNPGLRQSHHSRERDREKVGRGMEFECAGGKDGQGR